MLQTFPRCYHFFLCTLLIVFVKVTTDEQDEAKALHEKRLEEEVRFTSDALVIHDK